MDNIAGTSKIVRLYILTGFIYFIIGTLLLAFDMAGIISIRTDPIFILLLYGFVTQLIFGVSYIFVPGVSRHRGANYKIMALEYVLLNSGIILFESVALEGQMYRSFLLIGLFAMLVAVVFHAVNIWRIIIWTKAKNAGSASASK